MYNITLRRDCATIVAVEKQKYYIFWVRICRLRHPACNAHALNCHTYVACQAVQYFSTLSHKRHDFRKKLLNIKCVFSCALQDLSITFIILRRIKGNIIIKEYWSSCKVLVIPVRF